MMILVLSLQIDGFFPKSPENRNQHTDFSELAVSSMIASQVSNLIENVDFFTFTVFYTMDRNSKEERERSSERERERESKCMTYNVM